VRGKMMSSPLLATSFIDRAGELFGDVEIVSRRADRSIHRYTYKECRDRARRLAMTLRGLGLRPGDRVANSFLRKKSREQRPANSEDEAARTVRPTGLTNK
jgi:acyl-CoA synthetase (AMP-forming)/AMP-acid ligase II